MHDRRLPQRYPVFTYEIIFDDLLAEHVDALRSWLTQAGGLLSELLADLGMIGSCEELFDKELWASGVGRLRPGTKTQLRFSKLGPRVWANLRGDDPLEGLGISLRPEPHVPEPLGWGGHIDLSTSWYPELPNYLSVTLPARYCVDGFSRSWLKGLIDSFQSLGCAVGTQVGCLGWHESSRQWTRHPIGSVDFRNQLWAPGWAMLLSDAHIELLGGVDELRRNPMFAVVDQLADHDGRPLFYIECTGDPAGEEFRDFDGPTWASLTAFLDPILLPPPVNPAAALDGGADSN